mgnify:CR=1 FL=1
MKITTQWEMKGAIFDGRAPHLLKDVMSGAVKELIEDGESILGQKLRPASAGVYEGSLVGGTRVQTSTGNYRRNISTRITELNGLITDGGVVYGPWLEGISSRNMTTRFKGYMTFRKTSQELEKKSREVFNKYLRRFVDRVNR